MEAKALSGENRQDVHVRVARTDDEIVLDLGREDGLNVVITRDGWNTSYLTQCKMIRRNGLGELPIPERGGNLNDLQDLLSLSELNWHCVVAFMLNALRGEAPHMALFVDGPQGSGKSILSTFIKMLIDPNGVTRLRLPRGENDLYVHAGDNLILSYDNASFLTPDMSDALCTLATGGGLSKRKLYSDGDSYVVNYSRPVIINRITEVVVRPDLLSRGIPVHMTALPDGKRLTEKELKEKFVAMRPKFLGSLCDAIAQALSTSLTVTPSRDIRMMDSGVWIEAAEAALGFPTGTLLDSIKFAQNEAEIDLITNDPVVEALIDLVTDGGQQNLPFEGTVSQLLARLNERTSQGNPKFPKSASALSKWMRRIDAYIHHTGLKIEWLERTKKGRPVKIWMAEGAPPEPEF